jgi:hypothetical protein
MLIFLENTPTLISSPKSPCSPAYSLPPPPKGRHLHHLHADDPGSDLRDAGLRAAGGHALGRFWRVCRAGVGRQD